MIKPSPQPDKLKPTSQEQKQVLETIKKYATGAYEGIQSQMVRKADIEQFKAKAKAMSTKAVGTMSAKDVGNSLYTEAAYRDARYAVAGRKFLRVAGLNGNVTAAYGRASAMATLTGL